MTELVSIYGVRKRDSGVTVAFNVAQDLAESLAPTVGDGVPCPARHLLETTFAIGSKATFGAESTLRSGPLTEPVAIYLQRFRDAGLAVLFDVTQEMAEPFLPLVSAGIPAPSG